MCILLNRHLCHGVFLFECVLKMRRGEKSRSRREGGGGGGGGLNLST